MLEAEIVWTADLIWKTKCDSAGNLSCKTVLPSLRPHVEMITVERFSESIDVQPEGVATNNLRRVWQLFKPSSRFELVSRRVRWYIYHVYIAVYKDGNVPIKVPLSIRAEVDNSQSQGHKLWPEG